jgi:glycosyltransferase involved in cell wall biosynthesis
MLKRIAVIVPAYNEEKCIAGVIESINLLNTGNEFKLDVIVVNDASIDSTGCIASKKNCTLLDLPVNVGIGGAVQTGFKYAFSEGYDYAMQVDGDGQHPPAEIPRLIKMIGEKDLDVVIGSRFIEKKGFLSSYSRRLGISFFKHILKWYTGFTITDCTSGFRIINRKTLSMVCETYPDEYPEPESIILYSRNHLRIGEVAVEMRERQGGRSSISAFNSIYYMIKVSIAIFFAALRSPKKVL